MKWWMVVAIVVTAVRIADAAEAGEPPTLDLQMRSEVGFRRIPEKIPGRSHANFRRTGTGRALDRDIASSRRDIVAQVLGYDRGASAVMGVALRTPNGSMAQVFFRQVQEFAHAYGRPQHDARERDRA